MPVRLIAVCGGHAEKARSDYGKPGGDNQVDHDFYPWCEARGGAGFGFLVATYGGSKAVEWRALEVLGALCGGHGS